MLSIAKIRYLNNLKLKIVILILNKLDHKYNRYDIVVFNYNGERLIKRIIGMPKDKIESKDNVLYINDIEVDENYISSPTNDFIEIVGDNEYLLLGDNRKNSFDSRYIGSINKNDIIGTISIRLFPFSKIGKIN